MRILLISHTCQSVREGQPRAECLAQIPGVELRVLVPQRWRHYGQWRSAEAPPAPAFQLEVGRVRWPWLAGAQNYLHWYPDLRRVLLEFRPELIDLWEEPWGLVSAHACWLRNHVLPTARIILETEQNISKTLPPPFELFRGYTLNNADHVVGRSSEALAVLRGKGYAGPEDVVPNAVDADLFKPLGQSEREASRRHLELDGFVVGYFGRLVEEKGLGDLADAIARCPRRVQLLVVGSGAYEVNLRCRLQARGCGDRARFLKRMPIDQLPAIMAAVDLLALPSRTTPRWKEQFGRVIIESHACGVPVIASDSGAIPEVVGRGGVVVPEGDVEALADAICALADDPDAAREMGQAGRRQVEQHYTWQRVAERMHAIYQRVHACRFRPMRAEGAAAAICR